LRRDLPRLVHVNPKIVRRQDGVSAGFFIGQETLSREGYAGSIPHLRGRIAVVLERVGGLGQSRLGSSSIRSHCSVDITEVFV